MSAPRARPWSCSLARPWAAGQPSTAQGPAPMEAGASEPTAGPRPPLWMQGQLPAGGTAKQVGQLEDLGTGSQGPQGSDQGLELDLAAGSGACPTSSPGPGGSAAGMESSQEGLLENGI